MHSSPQPTRDASPLRDSIDYAWKTNHEHAPRRKIPAASLRRQKVVELIEHDEGWVVRVRATPGARENGVRGEHGGALKVSVTQPPDKGKANEAIVAVLAEALGVKKSQIELLSGAASREKRILIRGVSPERLQSVVR